MAKDLANIRIYGDEASAISVAPEGTALPTTLGALNAAFDEVGWISEDGTEITREASTNEFSAWQGGTIVRVKPTGVKNTMKFQCLEETAITLGLYYPGSTGATATGVSTISVGGGANTDVRSWVADFHDGDVHKRYVIERGEVTGQGSIAHKSTEMTIYEFTLTIYGDFTIITDNPAVSYA
jgi:hypothetical protein